MESYIWSSNSKPDASHFLVALYFALCFSVARLSVWLLSNGSAPLRKNIEATQAIIAKCSESMWKLTYFATVETWILKITYYEPWFRDVKGYFRDWPNQELNSDNLPSILNLHSRQACSLVLMCFHLAFCFELEEHCCTPYLRDSKEGLCCDDVPSCNYYYPDWILVCHKVLICSMIMRQWQNRGKVETAKMPEEWRESTVIPIYKNKGDSQRCGNYRGIKLLSHTMKLWERMIEDRLRQITRVSKNQFGFMPGRSTTETIHLLQQLMEKYREKNRDLHMAFIDLEKAYDSVPRDTIWKTLETRWIPTAYIRAIRDMYCRSTTHYIFALIMDDIYCATLDGVPWCMLFADDIVLVAETRTELNSRLTTWKTVLEEKGLRINIAKTKYLSSNFSGNQNAEDVEVCIEGHVLPSKDCFKYLESMIHKDGGVDDDVTHRIKAGWLKWRAATGVLCDKKVPLKLKGKFYRMAIRPTLLYRSECWAIKKDHVRRMEAAEMRMLRWACGRTLWDMIPNSAIRMSLGAVPVSEKLREGRLRWFGHVLRRQPSDTIRRVESIIVDGARRRGRPRRKWEDCLKTDLKDLALTEDMTSDKKVWRFKIRVAE
ncbi:Detected protein of unknown function [Hibiscus syriacus]|uniref:Reverse transcriptase domain-containing protein n=1 Tax=Hibiscus syriacus TaxID=106335 RepID=A0A6A3CI34_HIBSY|nr:Detected protein of unknown function [Hibiscus syriacus]